MLIVIAVTRITPIFITSQPWWQIFIILLTAIVTSSLGYYFADKSKRKAHFYSVRSTINSYGYLLQQVWSNRLQSELKAYYYQARKELATRVDDKALYHDLEKHEAFQQPELSIEINRIYGKLIEHAKLLKTLSNKKSYQKIATSMNELIVNHKSFFVKDIPAKIRSSMEEVYASNQKGHKYIDQIIDSEIRKKFITLNKELEEVKLRWQ